MPDFYTGDYVVSMEELNMNRLFSIAFNTGLVCYSGVYGNDGKGTRANFKAMKAIAGARSRFTYDSIMKIISAGSPTHSAGSCDVVQVKNSSWRFLTAY